MRIALGMVVLLLALPAAAGAQNCDVEPVMVTSYAQQFGIPETTARDRLCTQARGSDLGSAAPATLGDAYGGLWFDNAAGRFHLQVTAAGDRVAAERLLAERSLLGEHGVVETVEFSWRQLTDAVASLGRRLRGVGVSLGPDAVSNAVVILVYDGVTAEAEARVRGLAAQSPVRTTVTRVPYGLPVAVAKPRRLRPVAWRRVGRRPGRDARRVRIAFRTCGRPRITVVRSRTRIVIGVRGPTPCTRASLRRVVRTVGLRGRRGTRKLLVGR